MAAGGKSSNQGTVVAGIYGAGGRCAGDNPPLERLATGMGGKMFKANQEAKIVEYVTAGAAEGRIIAIYGYSRGGNAAVNVTNTLGKMGINVGLLVTFDAHSLTRSTFRLKYDNVGAVYNFYQHNPRTGYFWGWWGSNPYTGSPVTSDYITVNETNFTGDFYRPDVPVSHLNIVRHSLSEM